jgi:predicted amidohydrolase
MTVVRAAAVQHAPVFLDRDATVEKAVALIGEAAAAGAALVAFPETWVPCYPLWVFGGTGWEDPRGKEAYARLLENSVLVGDEATDRLCRAAARHGVHVVIGINELAPGSQGTIYNSLLTISANGVVLGVHRKLVPTHAERIVWGAGDGSTLHVYDTELGRLGGLICWEHWMPLTRFAMHAKGEQIHVAAWPEVPEIHHLASRHYAFEGRCFVVCAGTYLTVDMVPEELREAALGGGIGDDASVLLPGGSGIIGPDGSWVAGPAGNEETIVYGDMDLGRIPQEFGTLDAAGHYNRPDVFHLTVDARQRSQVTWLEEGHGAIGAGHTPAERE